VLRRTQEVGVPGLHETRPPAGRVRPRPPRRHIRAGTHTRSRESGAHPPRIPTFPPPPDQESPLGIPVALSSRTDTLL